METKLPISDAYRPEYLEYYGVLPLEVRDGRLLVAVAGAPCVEVLEDFERSFGAHVDTVDADRETLSLAIREHFARTSSTESLVRSLEGPVTAVGEVEAGLDTDASDLVNQPPVIQYVNLLIREAHEARASDIHLEAGPSGPNTRFRIDGVLTGATPPPRALHAAVVSRLKLIASLDIAERRTPQDGRIRVRLDQRDMDLRVSTLPTVFGESIVLRLLDEGDGPVGLEALGMDATVLDSFLKAARSAHGIVLATGPTGSGKTTTLYGALRSRRLSREKVITIEDPVEYHLEGVAQVPVNRRAGLTFASGLRAILRQDPDVIMVGEMRDSETAHIAVQAAMTGHVVFSTVHTNDAASAVTRLIDLGVEPYTVAATVQGILAQRLVRRVCGHCAEDVEPDAAFHELCPAVDSGRRLRRGSGCAFCRGTGYRGRLGIFEYLRVDDAMRQRLVGTPDATALLELARAQGMRTIREDGLEKIMAGLTTPSEVLRAVDA